MNQGFMYLINPFLTLTSVQNACKGFVYIIEVEILTLKNPC